MGHLERRRGADFENDRQTPWRTRDLTMVYLLFLAEAIMASSLSSQIAILVPSASDCVKTDANFLRSILECAYFFGSAAGLCWGCAADRIGRRSVALLGLSGMTACCLMMGWATTFLPFAILRCIAGMVSSATVISGWTMLADLTHGSGSRVKVVARLPMVGVCGNIGPLASHMLSRLLNGQLYGTFAEYPGLSGQLACASLVSAITIAEVLLLTETLPTKRTQALNADCEKAALLASESEDISITKALNDNAAVPLPSKMTISQILVAPSTLVLIASFSMLSLHSSTFDVLLPHIGQTATQNAGMGIPCVWLKPAVTLVQVIAAIRVLHFIPFIVQKAGVLQVYRRASAIFPVIYAVIPLAVLTFNMYELGPLVSGIFSIIVLLAKSTLVDAAEVLVRVIALSAAPDASSTGAVLGLLSIAELFKALAVGGSGLSYYLSGGISVVFINELLWLIMALFALVGVTVTWKLRENPRVGTDIPAECLAWQGVFDAESEGDAI